MWAPQVQYKLYLEQVLAPDEEACHRVRQELEARHFPPELRYVNIFSHLPPESRDVRISLDGSLLYVKAAVLEPLPLQKPPTQLALLPSI